MNVFTMLFIATLCMCVCWRLFKEFDYWIINGNFDKALYYLTYDSYMHMYMT